MALSAYDIKRIASEILSQQRKELSNKLEKAVNRVIEDTTDEWLNTAQASKFLKMSERQLFKLKEEGRIAYSKPNGRIYYKRSNLIAYMDKK